MTTAMPRRLPKYCIEDTDRHGKTRIYLRKPGERKVCLEGTPWTPAFMEAYEAAMAGAPKVKSKAKPNTLRWLCECYYTSPEYKRLDARTRRVRRGILESMYAEPTKPGADKVFGDMPLSALSPKAVRVLRDRKGELPEAANGRVKALRQVFAYGIAHDHMTANPARDVPYLRNGSQGFHSWTLEEVEQYEAAHPIGTTARLALALLLYTSQRRSDVVLFGRQHVRDGWLKFTQFKNRNRKPITLELPIVPELQEIIDATKTGDLTFLVTEFGKGFTSNGFGNRMRKWCDAAGLPQCSAHGLRKAAAARLAELGRSEQEIMAVTGHTTSKEVARYVKAARQKLLAARAMGVQPKNRGGLSEEKSEENQRPSEAMVPRGGVQVS